MINEKCLTFQEKRDELPYEQSNMLFPVVDKNEKGCRFLLAQTSSSTRKKNALIWYYSSFVRLDCRASFSLNTIRWINSSAFNTPAIKLIIQCVNTENERNKKKTGALAQNQFNFENRYSYWVGYLLGRCLPIGGEYSFIFINQCPILYVEAVWSLCHLRNGQVIGCIHYIVVSNKLT